MRPDPAHRSRRAALLRCVLPACLLLGGAVAAQDTQTTAAAPPAVVTRSGDAWTDLRLHDIDAYAARYPGAFVDELVRYLDAPRALVEARIAGGRVMPGDVYYACAIARVSGQPCRSVLVEWQGAPAQDRTQVAARHGVAPGTEGATRLRELIEGSYRHWARPPPETPGQSGGPGESDAVSD